ncbi:MAG TPA: S41 family peptidase [Candidatus Kapabacteria bacterium]|nr:S41 family peptidase [Candidatus Kapabacteria bacterium]
MAHDVPLTNEQTFSIALYCKVWGFLKYYHTAVASGTVSNWDQIFIDHYDKIRSVTTRADAYKEILSIIEFADSKRDKWKENASVLAFDSLAVTTRPDMSWMFDTSQVSPELSAALQKIKSTFYPVANRYCGGARDETDPNTEIDDKFSDFSDKTFPEEPYRILGLARCWNILNYFYTNLNLVGRSWDSVLLEAIPRMIHTNDALEYALAYEQLARESNDNDIYVNSKTLDEYHGKGWLPFSLMYINSQFIITHSYTKNEERADAVLRALGLKTGDILLSINDKPVADLRNTYAQYRAASSEEARDRYLCNWLLRGKLDDSVRLTISNGERQVSVTTTFQDRLRPGFSIMGTDVRESGIFNGNIGYVNLGKINSRNVDKIMESMMPMKAIIFDLRNNTNNSIFRFMGYMIPKTPFAYSVIPVVPRPGYFVHTKKKLEEMGSERGIKYLGQVILLVNEYTQGFGEYAAIALQAIPGAITVGSHTAGSIARRTFMKLPGGVEVTYPYAGYYYLFGNQVQRNGVKIDIPIKPTIPGISEGRDEVLERAIQYFNTGK